jgi:hypothetical protein
LQVEDFGDSLSEKDMVAAFDALAKPETLEKNGPPPRSDRGRRQAGPYRDKKMAV